MKKYKLGLLALFAAGFLSACSSTTDTAQVTEEEENTRMSQEELDDCRNTGSRIAKRC
ncbi:hypothetical protein [Aestuariibacter salexigens]|uniref:hypothetical protein n=1 Tax=Aestuariibacter salexigens TaxID=226010 RepID=UPI000409DC66|nr:hypothetical protein [Aestuariibacter salexigens]